MIVAILRTLPRLIRDLRSPLPDIPAAPDDAEPMAHVLPNDDGWFTSSLRLPEDRGER